jgi:hypothetical protein
MALPHVGHQLLSLDLLDTYNSQAVHLLRTGVPGGVLPSLRSMGIQLRPSSHEDRLEDGHRWREDEHGRSSVDNSGQSTRYFDGNYIMSVANAAPNLEELELMGPSEGRLVHDKSLSASRYYTKSYVVGFYRQLAIAHAEATAPRHLRATQL